MQAGDVYLRQTDNDGDINVTGGVVEMRPGLETASYLSMFGGNEEDPGGSDTTFQFWGNISEEDNAKKYRSETQHLLQSIPATSGNMGRVSDAVKRDLNWMLDSKVASSIDVSITIPAINHVGISVSIKAQGEEQQFNFTENWKASI